MEHWQEIGQTVKLLCTNTCFNHKSRDQPTITCLKLTIETLEKGVNYVTSGVVLVPLLLF